MVKWTNDGDGFWVALRSTVCSDNISDVTSLLESTNPKVVKGFINRHTQYGHTLLELASFIENRYKAWAQSDSTEKHQQYASKIQKQAVLLDILLQHGVNPNIRRVGFGQTLLYRVVEDHIANTNTSIIATLLKHGADPNLANKNTGLRPLDVAAVKSMLGVMKLLLANGANPNLQDASGMTALHYAVEAGDLMIVNLLMEHGANPYISDNHGLTPLRNAEISKPREMFNLMNSYQHFLKPSVQDTRSCMVPYASINPYLKPDSPFFEVKKINLAPLYHYQQTKR